MTQVHRTLGAMLMLAFFPEATATDGLCNETNMARCVLVGGDRGHIREVSREIRTDDSLRGTNHSASRYHCKGKRNSRRKRREQKTF